MRAAPARNGVLSVDEVVVVVVVVVLVEEEEEAEAERRRSGCRAGCRARDLPWMKRRSRWGFRNQIRRWEQRRACFEKIDREVRFERFWSRSLIGERFGSRGSMLRTLEVGTITLRPG